jgi:intein/homing endonuclease
MPSWNKGLTKNGDLAELIGLVLGDGSIHRYARTEGLRIVLPTSRPKLIKRYAELTEKVFGKKPSVIKRKDSNCVDIRLYQQGIGKRLGVPIGPRAGLVIKIPSWISKNNSFMIRYLRGLYEAEGSFCTHKPTYTYKFLFSNHNKSMRANVFKGMVSLGFHPHMSPHQVQISRKEEVYRAMKVLSFRKYT